MDDKQTDGTKPPEDDPAVDDEDPRNGKRPRSRGAGSQTTFGGVQPFDFAGVAGVDTEWLRTLMRPANLEQIDGIASLARGAAGFNSNLWSNDLLRSAISAPFTNNEIIKNLIGSLDLGVWQGLSGMRGVADLGDAGRLSAQFAAAGIHGSLLGGLRANLGITSKIEDLAASIAGTVALGEISTLVATANSMTGVVAQLQAQAGTRDVLLRAAALDLPTHRLLAARPLAAYGRLFGQLISPLRLAGLGVGEREEPYSLGLLHGHAVDGLVARDALFRAPSDERLDDLLDLVESRVIEPWRGARARVGEHLHSALFGVDPKLAELFGGAWETLDRQGSGYVEATCHLILETLQMALRALAPDDQVVAWAAEQRVPESEVRSRGRVTRRIRLRYLFATGSKSERRLVVAEVEAIDKSVEALVVRLNAGKHASEADLAVCRAHLCSVEAVLLHLFAAGSRRTSEDHGHMTA